MTVSSQASPPTVAEPDREFKYYINDGIYGSFNRWRDCHFAAPPSTFNRCFNSDEERASAK